MQQRVQTLAEAVRQIRIVHVLLLFSMFLYVVIGERFLQHPAGSPSKTLLTSFYVDGFVAGTAGFLIRQRKIAAAVEALQRKPEDPTAIGWWRFGNILGSVMADSVALLGFVWRLLGGPLKESAPFYIAALALMVIWWPREP